MKVRDGHAVINGDKTTHTMPSGSLEIVADNGNTLFGINQEKDGSIQIRVSGVCKFAGKILDDRFSIEPVASNVIRVSRSEYPSR